MNIQSDISLHDKNTLALPGKAEYFCSVTSDEELQEALQFARRQQMPVTVLGEGSNIVLAGNIRGLVVRMAIPGREPVCRHGEKIHLRVGAGENWHQLVCHCLTQNWYGLENLSLIPGCAGAAPIQNIGAYGVELSDRFVSLEAVALSSGQKVVMSRDDCRFGYRDSIFKREIRDRLAISAITLALDLIPHTVLDYPALRNKLEQMAIDEPRPQDISKAVCAIRRSKLPDPARIPNAGSFFKNPLVDRENFTRLQRDYPGIVAYPQSDHRVKLAAAWLIEQAGWKGYQRGDVGVHNRQALVLVNRGRACGAALLSLAEEIAVDIFSRFGVELEFEPRVLGV